MFTYVFWRHDRKMQSNHATLSEAIDDACGDWDAGEASYVEILDERGNVVMDHEALQRAIFNYDERSLS